MVEGTKVRKTTRNEIWELKEPQEPTADDLSYWRHPNECFSEEWLKGVGERSFISIVCYGSMPALLCWRDNNGFCLSSAFKPHVIASHWWIQSQKPGFHSCNPEMSTKGKWLRRAGTSPYFKVSIVLIPPVGKERRAGRGKDDHLPKHLMI